MLSLNKLSSSQTIVNPLAYCQSWRYLVNKAKGEVQTGNKRFIFKGALDKKFQYIRSLHTPPNAITDTTKTAATDYQFHFGDVKAKDLPKNFDPDSSESKIYQWWENSNYFEPNGEGEPFTIMMPPPNVTGKLHMGHAIFVTLQDIMIRFNRMNGKAALWLPGTDHAGIATQMVVEKILAQEGVSRQELGREKFEERVWKWKAEYGGYISQQLRKLGASCDWKRERFTLDENMSRAVMEAFVRLHEKGLVYRGDYMVNWSPSLQTAISDLEVEYFEEPGSLYFFKYPLADSLLEFIPVATTRPETILGDTAVAVNPDDERYSKYIGKTCLVPFCNRKIPVVADDYVDKEFGTGALKVTPAHDPNDYEIGKRLGLDFVNIMNKDGSLNENGGPYEGMDRFEARKQVWHDLCKSGLGIREESYVVRVPRSQRGGEVIEPLISSQWFVRMVQMAAMALEAVREGEVALVPMRFAQTFESWMENIRDWCVSRQLWWGHRIPVWYVQETSNMGISSNRSEGDKGDYVVARDEAEARKLAEEKYGQGVVLKRDEDVLDTWFSSGLWPFSTLGWPEENSQDLKKFYPTQVLETGHDILFFWVARMMMMSLEFTGKVPFSTIYLHGLVRDEKGRKMSKSLGNVIDPIDAISKYGTDPLRFALATGTAIGQDLTLNPEKLVSARNFCNKIWNIGKFISANLPDNEHDLENLSIVEFNSEESLRGLSLSEKWIISRLHEVVDRVTAAHGRYDLGEVGRELYDFVWFDFADWYIESSKTSLYNNQNPLSILSAQRTLVYTFDKILKLLHPFLPFITERLWQGLPHQGSALIISQWPIANGVTDKTALFAYTTLQDIVRAVRNARAEYSVELGRKIPAKVLVPDSQLLKELEGSLQVLGLLAKIDMDNLTIGLPDSVDSRDKAVTCVVKNGIEVLLPMSGLFNPKKEIERLQKQRAKVVKELEGTSKRLENPEFLTRAPENVINEVITKKREFEEQLKSIDLKIVEIKIF